MITKKDSVKELAHHFSGNGFAVVQWLPDGMCRLMSLVTKTAETARVFLAWEKLVQPWKVAVRVEGQRERVVQEVLLNPHQLEWVQDVSAGLQSGKYEVRQTRIYDVETGNALNTPPTRL